MLREILVPIRGDGKGENVLAHAAVLARRFTAHISAVHCRPRPADMLPFGIPVPGYLRDEIVKSASSVANAEEAKLRAEFDGWVRTLGLTPAEGPDGAATVSWEEAEGKQVDVIKTHGRLADLIAVAKPDRDRNLGANTLKSALFHTGRPVLMCPPRSDRPNSLGSRVSIAWNGSTEVARAVALTLDLIQAADEVIVLSGGDEIHGATADDLMAYLNRRNIYPRLVRFERSARNGEMLLSKTVEAGADLMIMGAYRNSHEHETLFGGNTQQIVDTTNIPVVLVH